MTASESPVCRAFLITAVLSVSLWGCGSSSGVSGPDKSRVSGTVTWNGAPLPSGQIRMIDAEGDSPRTYVGDISEGRFEFDVTPGRKRVEIRAFREDQSAGGDPNAPDPQYLPARYNDQTTLEADIGDSNDGLRFELSEQGAD